MGKGKFGPTSSPGPRTGIAPIKKRIALKTREEEPSEKLPAPDQFQPETSQKKTPSPPRPAPKMPPLPQKRPQKKQPPTPPPEKLPAIVQTTEDTGIIPDSRLTKNPVSQVFPKLRATKAPLFHGPVRRNQARQGAMGNCWLMAPLAAIAYTRPGFIQNKLCSELQTVQGERAFKVNLYPGAAKKQESLFVDANLPHSGSKLPLAHPGIGQKAVWAAIVEKAVAAHLRPAAPQYSDTRKGAGLTGHKLIAGQEFAKSRNLYKQPSAVVHDLLNKIINDNDYPTTVTRIIPNPDANEKNPEHEYVVDDYEDEILYLYDQRDGTYVEFTLEQICKGKKSGKYLKYINWCELPDDPEDS